MYRCVKKFSPFLISRTITSETACQFQVPLVWNQTYDLKTHSGVKELETRKPWFQSVFRSIWNTFRKSYFESSSLSFHFFPNVWILFCLVFCFVYSFFLLSPNFIKLMTIVISHFYDRKKKFQLRLLRLPAEFTQNCLALQVIPDLLFLLNFWKWA